MTGPAQLIMDAGAVAADRDRWLAERRGSPGDWRVTASEMSAVLGLAPPEYGSAFALYHEKLTGAQSFEGSDRTDLGLYLEDHTAARFAAQYPELVVGPGGLYVSAEHRWLAATPDRIAWHAAGLEGGGEVRQLAGPAQLKSWGGPRGDFGPAGSAVMPVNYRVQLLTEMAVLGADEGWLPVIWLPGGKVSVFHVKRDADAEADIAAILAAGEEFCRRLDDEDEPPVDWTPATARTLRRLYSRLEDRQVRIPARLARRYRRARDSKAAAGRRLEQVKNEMRQAAGPAAELVAWDALTGSLRRVARRTGGPVSGYWVKPADWREQLNPGDWGKPPKHV